ncbi:YdeI/OmpD-associated family protein [Pedobacter sp. B4-66]|uniref:YdeI/OmpD-associated family protein n=1 Tax=Pedobacter sp. B4-66 TaxID=2817280 RepID=UPI001BDA7207|nr:YdeI/OmpD-associated family protein [Pedobacter sp. B4-66]
MSAFNPAFDEYIAKSADFAKPILNYLREIIHETCPEAEEIIKWGYPHFDYKADMMLILAAAKTHCSFSLYKAELMHDPKVIASVKAGQKMGFMVKLKSLADLPSKEILVAYIKEAMELNEKGIKKPKPQKAEAPNVIEIPDYFAAALALHPEARAIFESKSPSFRKDYLVWIIDAKTEATRQKRMEQALEWIAQGKGRFWQYAK